VKTVLILCGGRSLEHEISLISAKCILDALDRAQYVPIVVGIDKQGVWHLQKDRDFFTGEFRADHIQLKLTDERVSLDPFLTINGRGRLTVEGRILEFDVVFPVLHGSFGEDGTLQGLLDIIGIPYVGSGCASSAVCMDKALTKATCERMGISVAPYVCLSKPEDLTTLPFAPPVFVKPARQGSSVGITRVTDLSQLEAAVKEAFRYDSKVLVEQGIDGREIECAVLGRGKSARVALPGEIQVAAEIGWYSYEAKYLSKTAAKTVVPAALTPELTKQAQDLALRAFQVLECDGLARVDLLVTPHKVYLNEVNTLPGFTPISMYPMMWIASGLPYPALINELLSLALDRYMISAS